VAAETPAAPGSCRSLPGTLVDVAARREAVESRARVVVVEAGAGSGKTTVLVERIVALVSSGAAELRQVAAITFTEAAASELRERVRRELRSRAAADGSSGRLAGALDQVDEAVMGTTHGFCRRVLVDHALEAGLPPGFEVLDEVAYELDTERRLGAFFEELAGDRDMTEWLSLAKAIAPTLKPDDLDAAARALDGTFGREPVPPPLFRTSTVAGSSGRLDAAGEVEARVAARAGHLFDALLHSLGAALDAARRCEVRDGDALVARLRLIEPVAVQLARAPGWSRRLRLLCRLPSLRVSRLGNAKNWSKDDLSSVRAWLAEADESRTALLRSVGEEVAGAVLARCRSFVAAAAYERRDEGRLGFDDLLVWTRALLHEVPAVRDAVATRYPFLFIDEMQDTDPLQLEIAALLAGAGSGTAESRPGAPVASLFVVGDPKQSIYRFRGADLRAYAETRRRLVGAASLRLRSNFRSRTEVVRFVNAAFGPLLAPHAVDLDAARPPGEQPADPAVWRLGDVVEEEGVRVVDLRRREAADVALGLERLLGRSGAPGVETFDPELGRLRPLAPGDVAVLVPRRTGVAELADALARHEIPYRLDSAALFLEEEEVRAVLRLARALENPGDDVALLAALRSPVLACEDAELAEFAAAGGRWSLDAEPPATLPEDHRVVRAVARLRDLHRRRRATDPLLVLAELVASPEVAVLAGRDARASERFARLDYLLAEARAFFAAGGASLTSFVAWFERKRRVDVPSVRGDDSRARGREAGSGAVQILTVHGAKGLEFPAVVLAGFGAVERRYEPTVRVLAPARGAGGQIGLRLRAGLETAGFGELDLREEEELRAEQRRLLYVAATRARDYLVICAHRRGRDRAEGGRGAGADGDGGNGEGDARGALAAEGPVLAEVLAAAEGAGVVLVDLLEREPAGAGSASSRDGASRETLEPPERGDALAVEVGGAAAAGLLATWRAARASLLETVRAPRSFTVAELVEEGGRRAPVEGGQAALALGSAVHAVLERVELVPRPSGEPVAADDLEELGEREATRYGLVGRGAEVAELARSVLCSRVLARAAAAARRWRELPVVASVDLRAATGRRAASPPGEEARGEERFGALLEVGVEGIVDLCFEEEGELVVVEYKIRRRGAGAPRDGGSTRLGRRDRLQGGLYALALASSASRPVREVVFVVASPGAPARELALDDLDGARGEAVGLLRARLHR
jgi:ATP-dependent helicase/nuclease subunit A